MTTRTRGSTTAQLPLLLTTFNLCTLDNTLWRRDNSPVCLLVRCKSLDERKNGHGIASQRHQQHNEVRLTDPKESTPLREKKAVAKVEISSTSRRATLSSLTGRIRMENHESRI
ncbi:uncharacterized protein LOC123498878 [Portunus trituberculatus]|uniref:uncharacterized protein LOC123498878 n=1 Tax=Portunus trituberculatus TaxID=210409 RepID=UPI001E1CDEDC|nr:uncharacterized protein LOC123498878 [Portunus trituberculatus]